MPVALVSSAAGGGFVPVARTPFRLGRDLADDLVEADPLVARRHATLSILKGEYVLAAGDGHAVVVNDEPVPFLPLRTGDRIRLRPGGRPWTFRNRLEGAFVPPGASLAEAWMAHPDFASPTHGPDRLGAGEPLDGRDPGRCRRVPAPDGAGAWVVKILGPVRGPADGDRHLLILAALGGATHPALAPLLEGGLAPVHGVPQRWMATRWMPGTSARDAIRGGGLAPPRLLRALRSLAGGLAHLHARGVVHRDVAPGNVILGASGDASLVDYGQAVLASEGAPPSRGIVGTPGYLAPEEVLEGGGAVAPALDVYGLAAVGYALATGGPPVEGADVLETVARAAQAPARPRDLGVALPAALEAVLLEGLAPDAALRPTAAAFLKALDFAEVELGLGGSLA